MESSTLNDTQMNALFSSHNLDYSPPESSNLILSRTACDKQSTLNEYKSGSNTSIDVYIGSDNELLWGPSSYLSFDLMYEGKTNDILESATFGSVVSSLITRVTITCKGTVIYDVDGFNILNNIETLYSCPKEYVNNTGTIEGYNTQWNAKFKGKYTRVAMPLHNISFFAQDKYIPLLALSPLKISFFLNKSQQVFPTGTVDTTNGYAIKKFKLNLDLFVPQDVVRVGILKLVKQQVLTLAYTHYNHLNSPVVGGSNTLNLRKSVQKCQSIVSQVRPRYSNAEEAKHDSRVAVPYSYVKNWYFNAGCKRMPNNPVEGGTVMGIEAGGGVDAYISALNAFGTFTSCTRPPNVTLDAFIGTPATSSRSVMAVDLEKDITAEAMLSGISLNSTDDISLNLYMEPFAVTTEIVGLQADTFLSYLRLIVVGTSNISIKE